MNFPEKLKDAQTQLSLNGWDGWLMYDFRRQNSLAVDFLEIPSSIILTRRFYYWIPPKGEPVKIVHAIEEKNLDHLPGSKIIYHTWQELEKQLRELLRDQKTILMEYSPRNAIPYLSKVDGGTLEYIRSLGVEVASSGNLIQRYTCVWDKSKYQAHVEAANILSDIVDDVWQWISNKLLAGEALDEYQVQQHILDSILSKGCAVEEPPIVAVNVHSADPHYLPTPRRHAKIMKNDFILIDLSCRKNHPQAPFADITRVAVAAARPSAKQKEIFEIVRMAQETALNFVKERFANGEVVLGCEVDQACRQVIKEKGYGKYFIHRTGHNLDTRVHGPGANLDDYETCDTREVLAGTCFTIEPGIYLRDEFGIRLEYDVYMHPSGKAEVNGGVQTEIRCLM